MVRSLLLTAYPAQGGHDQKEEGDYRLEMRGHEGINWGALSHRTKERKTRATATAGTGVEKGEGDVARGIQTPPVQVSVEFKLRRTGLSGPGLKIGR
ncbi:MAG: hypothetical protein D9V47_11340 [Clostridia bacterium]|nr:MAG: hypothetical protein D9V47_11340 [Clostridia bacterium]